MYNTDHTNSLHIFEEALAGYVNSLGLFRSGAHLSAEYFFNDPFLVIHAIRKGLTFDVFDRVRAMAPYSEQEWADFLSLSTKTLHRYSNEKGFIFKPIHSEKILELAEVITRGLKVFGKSEAFYAWLAAASPALGHMSPSDLLKDSYGQDLILDELNRIEHGIFA